MISDEEKDYEAVRIKHRGPCSSYKGHCHEGLAFILGVCAGTFSILFALDMFGMIK